MSHCKDLHIYSEAKICDLSREETLYEEMLKEITINAALMTDCQRTRVKLGSTVKRLLE